MNGLSFHTNQLTLPKMPTQQLTSNMFNFIATPFFSIIAIVRTLTFNTVEYFCVNIYFSTTTVNMLLTTSEGKVCIVIIFERL